MAKINIYLPDDLLERIDRVAGDQGRSRSSVVQEATADYIARTLTHDERAARRESILQAVNAMEALAAEAKESDPYPDVSLSEMLIEERRLGHDAPTEDLVESIRRRRRGES